MRDRAMDSTVRGRRVRPVRSRRAALAAVLGLAVLLPPALSACAPEPDAQATRSSLSKVTEPAAPPKAAEKFDAKKHPEPVAQPEYCTAYLVITARGTGEPVGNQLVTPVARRIAEARPGEMLTVDLFYPADTDINEGGTEGVRRLIDQLNVQAEHCPDQRTILLGYSQGAFVIGDALADPKDPADRRDGRAAQPGGARTRARRRPLRGSPLRGRRALRRRHLHREGRRDPPPSCRRARAVRRPHPRLLRQERLRLPGQRFVGREGPRVLLPQRHAGGGCRIRHRAARPARTALAGPGYGNRGVSVGSAPERSPRSGGTCCTAKADVRYSS
uniref:Cutinase domain-containing protein n=1 Tax=Caenorhabditis tropicalis TaxID=1561998 RepID=A0A1I7SY50_9PELO